MGAWTITGVQLALGYRTPRLSASDCRRLEHNVVCPGTLCKPCGSCLDCFIWITMFPFLSASVEESESSWITWPLGFPASTRRIGVSFLLEAPLRRDLSLGDLLPLLREPFSGRERLLRRRRRLPSRRSPSCGSSSSSLPRLRPEMGENDSAPRGSRSRSA